MMPLLPVTLHGVHGPDVSIEDGKALLGETYIRIIDLVELPELNMTDEEIVAVTASPCKASALCQGINESFS